MQKDACGSGRSVGGTLACHTRSPGSDPNNTKVGHSGTHSAVGGYRQEDQSHPQLQSKPGLPTLSQEGTMNTTMFTATLSTVAKYPSADG